MSKRTASNPSLSLRTTVGGMETSIVRCAIAAVFVIVGIVWITLYATLESDYAHYIAGLGTKPSNPLPWMGSMKNWNYVIGFLAIFIGLIVSSHRLTPLGRGRGVVIGMLFCFLFGLAWILTFYMAGSNIYSIPVMKDLNQLNLLVGIGFMASGFTFATKWE